MCGIGSGKSGWLGGRASFLCYHTGQVVNDDYHKDMNSVVFNDWLVNKVVPLLPEKSVVVVDRASYHLVKTVDTRLPDKQTKKGLLEWLREKNIPLIDSTGRDWSQETDELILKKALMNGSGGMRVVELSMIVKKNEPEPRYEAQDILEGANKDLKMLILPVHHPELNPIELQWGRLKSFCERNNTTDRMSDVEKLALEEYDRITAQHWAGCERKAQAHEELYWEADEIEEDEGWSH